MSAYGLLKRDLNSPSHFEPCQPCSSDGEFTPMSGRHEQRSLDLENRSLNGGQAFLLCQFNGLA